jgi:hypothetical protein
MKASSRPPKAPSRLSDSLHRRLNMYALAASAAGVSVLALTQAAVAKIVYTKTHQVIGTNGVYPLDLNHDGTIDFIVQEIGYLGYDTNGLFVKEAFGNKVEGSVVTTSNSIQRYLAAALNKGVRIGPQQGFIGNTYSFGESMVRVECIHGCSTRGQWVNVKNRYLGLKFRIEGEIHYGWARLTTQVGQPQIAATLTGYAYETIPGKGIRAGQVCCDADEAGAESWTPPQGAAPTATEPASHRTQRAALGRLALGARANPFWRQPWK